MDVWKISLGVSRFGRKRKTDTIKDIRVEKDVIEEIEQRQLVLFRHGLEDNRWPKRILKYTAPQHGKRLARRNRSV